MPRTLDRRLQQGLRRANPVVRPHVEVSTPDVGLVLHRATDQLLDATYLVSEAPPASLGATAGGAMSLAATGSQIASLYNNDGTFAMGNADTAKVIKGVGWQVDPAFGRGILRKFTALIKKTGVPFDMALQLQIYRASCRFRHVAPYGPTNWKPEWTFVPLLPQPAVVPAAQQTYDLATHLADVVFDLTPYRLEVGVMGTPEPDPVHGTPGELSVYYFQINPVNAPQFGLREWRIDSSSPRTIPGVGTFQERTWSRTDTNDASAWAEQTFNYCEAFKLEVDSYAATGQALHVITLDDTPTAESTGRIVFERSVPTDADATLELSTAGSAGPWTPVTHGDEVALKQTTYHLRTTLDASANQRQAPAVIALGIEFRTAVDVAFESTVTPLSHEVSVPWCQGAIGEGRLGIVRAGGHRDYQDPATQVATGSAASKLEVDVFLASDHPSIGRDRWFLLDRALVGTRQPSVTSETLPLLSYARRLTRKIPATVETINSVHSVVTYGANALAVTPALPGATVSGNEYDGQGYYVRVRHSTAASSPLPDGYTQTIDGNTGTGQLDFTTALPGELAAGDLIEVHSARFAQPTLTWTDADPADIWWEILTVHLGIPSERIGLAELGTGSRAGLPPKVTDRAPGDATTQAKCKVTRKIKEATRADELLDQLSFLMGGATVELRGQIVFRQIYPLRGADGSVTVTPGAAAAVFDPRDYTQLETPTGFDHRITTLTGAYGVDTTAASDDTQPSLGVTYADGDAIAYLETQDVDELGVTTVPKEIAAWCFNSADAGFFLATQITQQVVNAASTGLRVWRWRAIEAAPELCVGDVVVLITDQYTDYDPSRQLAIAGWAAYTLVLVSANGGGREFSGYLLGLSNALPIKGGGAALAVDTTSGGPSMTVTPTDSFGDVTIAWAAGDALTAVTLSIDGGAEAAPPASPITVAKPTDGTTKVYTFFARKNGQVISIPVLVAPQPLGTISFHIGTVDRDDATHFTINWTASGYPTGSTLDGTWSIDGITPGGTFSGLDPSLGSYQITTPVAMASAPSGEVLLDLKFEGRTAASSHFNNDLTT